jgi:hypothetical protein
LGVLVFAWTYIAVLVPIILLVVAVVVWQNHRRRAAIQEQAQECVEGLEQVSEGLRDIAADCREAGRICGGMADDLKKMKIGVTITKTVWYDTQEEKNDDVKRLKADMDYLRSYFGNETSEAFTRNRKLYEEACGARIKGESQAAISGGDVS